MYCLQVRGDVLLSGDWHTCGVVHIPGGLMKWKMRAGPLSGVLLLSLRINYLKNCCPWKTLRCSSCCSPPFFSVLKSSEEFQESPIRSACSTEMHDHPSPPPRHHYDDHHQSSGGGGGAEGGGGGGGGCRLIPVNVEQGVPSSAASSSGNLSHRSAAATGVPIRQPSTTDAEFASDPVGSVGGGPVMMPHGHHDHGPSSCPRPEVVAVLFGSSLIPLVISALLPDA